jgi:hypothetical protein
MSVAQAAFSVALLASLARSDLRVLTARSVGCIADMTSISRVERRRFIVESVIGFHTVQELLGLRSSSTNADMLDEDADEDTALAAAAATARPIARLMRALQQQQHDDTADDSLPRSKRQRSDTAHSSSSCYSADTQYVPVAWCEQPGSQWCAVALAPASYTADGDYDMCSSTDSSGTAAAGAVLIDAELLCVPDATMAPDMAWVRRLNTFNNTGAGLLKTNAMLSTLGGGRFLCRQVCIHKYDCYELQLVELHTGTTGRQLAL